MEKINSVHVKDIDTCVTVTTPIAKGDIVRYVCSDGTLDTVVSNDEIPVYHKISIAKVEQGGFIYKYGENVGQAICEINPGDYVHIHNVKPVGHMERV